MTSVSPPAFYFKNGQLLGERYEKSKKEVNDSLSFLNSSGINKDEESAKFLESVQKLTDTYFGEIGKIVSLGRDGKMAEVADVFAKAKNDNEFIQNDEIKLISTSINKLLDNVTRINETSKKISMITEGFAASSQEISASAQEQNDSLEEISKTSKILFESANELSELIKNLNIA